MSKMKLVLDVVNDLHALAESIETLAKASEGCDAPQTDAPPAAPTTEPSKAASALTLVELRAYVAERSTPENRAKIKALLTKHGVSKLTELPEDQYAALKQEVAAL